MEFYLTTAGLAAFVNPANTGSNAITIDRIGVSSVALPGDPASHTGMLALPNELKRLDTFAGANVGDNIIHVTIRDESPDTYSLRTFGLYASTGVLLAYVTSAAVISEKTASSMTLIAADFAFLAAVVAEVVFGSTDFLNPPATTETTGVVELATAPEIAAGTDATRAVTPFGLKSLLTALLAGFSPAGHTHAAGDVTSGTFAVGRIPDLAQAKIAGLVDALLSKAASVHAHAMADVTGLVAALGLKLAVADFTWQNLVGKPNVAVNGLDAAFAALTSAGSPVWTSANFDPASRAAAIHTHAAGDVTSGVFSVGRIPDLAQSKITGLILALSEKAASIHSHSWAQITGKPDVVTTGEAQNLTGRKVAKGAIPGTLGEQSYLETPFEVQAKDAGAAAAMTFHIPGVAAQQIGLDVDGDWKVTRSGAARLIWTSFNFDPSSKAAAIHSHDWAQITGKPNVAILGQTAAFNDVYADRGNGTGVLFLGASGARYLEYDGAAYRLPNAPLYSDGHQVWTSSTGPSTPAAFRSNSDNRALTPNNVWSAAVPIVAAQTATIAIDLSAGLNFGTVMTGNRTLGAPTNAKPGQSGIINIVQDGVGGRTLAYDPAWKFQLGVDPVLSTTAGARDVLCYTVVGIGDVVASLLKDVK